MAGAAFVIRVAGAAVVFLSQILLARWMGSFEFGTYVYVWTWVLLVGDIIHLGLPLTAQRYIPEYTERKQFDRLRGFLLGSRWLVFAIGTAVAIARRRGRACPVAHILDSHTVVPLYLACVALPFYALSNMLDGIARSYNWINLALMPHFVLRPIVLHRADGGGACYGLHDRRHHRDGRLRVRDLGDARCCSSSCFDRRIAKSVPARSARLRHRGAGSRPRSRSSRSGRSSRCLTYTDVLVLQHFRPADEVAHYYAAAKTLALVAFIYFSVAAATAHRFAIYHVAGRPRRACGIRAQHDAVDVLAVARREPPCCSPWASRSCGCSARISRKPIR